VTAVPNGLSLTPWGGNTVVVRGAGVGVKTGPLH
jgi:hypothetical protein